MDRCLQCKQEASSFEDNGICSNCAQPQKHAPKCERCGESTFICFCEVGLVRVPYV